MKLAEPTKFNRKYGGAKWRDLQFLFSTRQAEAFRRDDPNAAVELFDPVFVRLTAAVESNFL
jgi:hypothetical protein